MVRLFDSKYIIFLLALALASCRACHHDIQDEIGQEKGPNNFVDSLVVSKTLLKNSLPNFSYESNLLFSMSNGTQKKDSQETITIVSDGQKLHFRKKIDGHHFIEIFQDNDEFIVKNAEGKWRVATDNKAMYQGLIDDGLDLISWTVKEYKIHEKLKQLGNKPGPISFDIKNLAILPESPFYQKLVLRAPTFKNIKRSNISGKITLSPKTNLPQLAHFDMQIEARDSSKIAMKANIKLAQNNNKKPLVRPNVLGEEPLVYPINIEPRFDAMMKQAQGFKNNEK